jgi:hypothetical protein
MMQCTARAYIFSGRPDPAWAVAAERARQLAAIWEGLEPSTPPAPAPPRLGYRGVSIRCAPGDEFIACTGFVTRTTGNAVECRKDRDRRYERLLLSTAPANTLPPGLLEYQNLSHSD